MKWGPKSTDEMGAMWLEVQPRRNEDVAVLMRDYTVRALAADIAGAEMQARVNPGDPLAHNFLATRYLESGRVDEAIAELNRALQLNPRDAEAHGNLASAYQRLGRVADSVREGRLAVALKPDDDRVRDEDHRLALVLVQQRTEAGEIDKVLKPGMVIMAEPNPITADGLFGIFLGHTFIVTTDGHECVDEFPLEIAVANG